MVRMREKIMEKQMLLTHLEQMPAVREAGWLQSLEERKLKELEFHNRDRDKTVVENLPQDIYEQLHGNKKYYRTTQLSGDYVRNWIATNAKGKVFLDYACGNGLNALFAARSGAALAIGIDISDISVRNATQKAREEGLSENTRFLQADCENTGLPDNSIDVIICSGMLHHLDLNFAFPELRRILKPGGVILGVEALDYNPVIKLYRMRTPQMRTEWEKAHILSYKDIRFARKFFEVQNIKHWHLFSIAGVKLPALLPLFNLLDQIVLKLPLIKLMSWMFTFELRKPTQ